MTEEGSHISNRELEDLLRTLDLALEASQIGIWQHNLVTQELVWDDRMRRLYALGKNDEQPKWQDTLHPDDLERAAFDFEDAIKHKSAYSSQFRVILADGEIRHMRSRAHYYHDRNDVPYFIGAEWDVTADVLLNQALADEKAVAESRLLALEESQARTKWAAEHDYLTGLPNRRCFDQYLTELRSAPIEKIAICHIDLDHFKAINDRDGHAAGDCILQHVGAALHSVLRPGDFAARVGGDEFVLVITLFADDAELLDLVEQTRQKVEESVEFEGRVLSIRCSVGIAWSDRTEIDALLSRSDIALYQVKKMGRGRSELYSEALERSYQTERRLLDELRSGLERDEIFPFYQIQVDARTRKLVGLEALARWNHPTRGLLQPAAFLEVAANHDLIGDIDDVMLRHVLQDRLEWIALGLDIPRVAVNISGKRLKDPLLAEKLARMPHSLAGLSFELVETIFLDEYDAVVAANIEHIRALGLEIEIDDLGSGHASLLGLIRLQPARIKIDRQMIMPILTSPTQCRIVASLIDIAKALDVEVVAEGVESEEHARMLHSLGAHTLQGYAIGFPEPSAAIKLRLLATFDAPVRKLK